jgi:hypothetical protein
MRGSECCLQKEEEMTFPSVLQLIKIRAGVPATAPINDRRVWEAFSTVNSYRGSRSTSSNGLDQQTRYQ